MAEKSGAVLGLVGAVMLIVLNIVAFQFLPWYSPPPADIIAAFILNFIMSFVWPGIIITGAILSFRGIKFGKYLILVGGIGILVGKMIPIAYYDFVKVTYYWGEATLLNFIPLNRSFFFLDAILVIIGGLTDLSKVD